MKSIKEVKNLRKFYHRYQNQNTKHRSLLTVPEFSIGDHAL